MVVGDLRVVVDHLALGEPGRRVEHLVEVGQFEVAPVDVYGDPARVSHSAQSFRSAIPFCHSSEVIVAAVVERRIVRTRKFARLPDLGGGEVRTQPQEARETQPVVRRSAGRSATRRPARAAPTGRPWRPGGVSARRTATLWLRSAAAPRATHARTPPKCRHRRVRDRPDRPSSVRRRAARRESGHRDASRR